MRLLKAICLFSVSLIFSLSAHAQMSAPLVLVSTSCNLHDGVTMTQVVEWFRANPRDSGERGPTFVREPLITGNNFMDSYDFRIASYFPSYDAMITDRESRQGRDGARVRPTPLARDMFSCDSSSQSISHIRAVPGGDAFTGESTLMSARFCSLDEGSSVTDAYNFITEVAAGFSRGGNKALMQVSTRQFKPVPNVDRGRAVVVTSVSKSAQDMAERLDLSREGFNPVAGLDGPLSCGFSSLWRTHAVYRPNN